jgi:hypothetical protein
MDSTLTALESESLTMCEQVIDRGLNTFYEVGRALMQIRDQRLYRQMYGTFEDYCQKRWQMGRRYVNQLIGASAVVDNLGTNGSQTPENERQARPLTQLEPEEQRIVWQVVKETAPNGKLSEAHIKSVVNIFKDVVSTGAIDGGDGIDIPIAAATTTHVKAAVNEELQERLKRQEVYIAQKEENKLGNSMKPKRNYTAGAYEPIGLDACQTPPYALTPLLPYLDRNLKIWEPASGEGFIVNTMRGAGYRVIESDILRGQNFFDYEPDDYDIHLTNPPYGIKYEWLERCYQLGKPFALLLPVETIGSKTAQALMQQHGFEMMLLDNRVDFKMPDKGFESSAQFPVLWLCWNLLPQQVVFGHISEEKSAWKSSMISTPAMPQAS